MLSYANADKTAVLHRGICYLDDYTGIGCNGYPRINGSKVLGPRAKKYSIDRILAVGGWQDPYSGAEGGDWLTTSDGRKYIIIPTKMHFREAQNFCHVIGAKLFEPRNSP